MPALKILTVGKEDIEIDIYNTVWCMLLKRRLGVPESFVGVFKLKKKKLQTESLPRFQSICGLSGIVYRTEPEKIFPANKPEFSL